MGKVKKGGKCVSPNKSGSSGRRVPNHVTSPISTPGSGTSIPSSSPSSTSGPSVSASSTSGSASSSSGSVAQSNSSEILDYVGLTPSSSTSGTAERPVTTGRRSERTESLLQLRPLKKRSEGTESLLQLRPLKKKRKSEDNNGPSCSSESEKKPDNVRTFITETQYDISCPICSKNFSDEDEVVPVMLPACGHTFCRRCLCNIHQLNSSISVDCPTCRNKLYCHPKDLPINYIALDLAKALDKMQTGLCETHKEKLSFWCNDCTRAVCGMCIFEEHVKDGHDVVKAKDLIEEKKSDVQTQGNEMLKGSILRRTAIISEFQVSILNLLGTLKDLTVVENCVKTAQEVLNTLDTCTHIQAPTLNLTRLESLQNTLSDLKYKFKQIENSESTNRSNLTSDNCLGLSSDIVLPKVCCIDNKKKICERLTWSPWSVFGRLSWEDEKLHLYAIVEKEMKADVILKVALLKPLIFTKNPEVFLDVTANGKNLGRIYIRLWGHLRRAQNFLQYCYGTSGISYKHAELNTFQKVGSPGETLGGGNYLEDNQSVFETKSVLKELEWGGEYSQPIKRGLIAGVGTGDPKYDSLFEICTRDDLHYDHKFSCPFGEVVAGLSVADKAIEIQSQNTKILDAGVVVIR